MKRVIRNMLVMLPLGVFLYFVAAYNIDIQPKPKDRIAAARCKDQTLSYSQHRSGTCSGHGGVAVWMESP